MTVYSLNIFFTIASFIGLNALNNSLLVNLKITKKWLSNSANKHIYFVSSYWVSIIFYKIHEHYLSINCFYLHRSVWLVRINFKRRYILFSVWLPKYFKFSIFFYLEPELLVIHSREDVQVSNSDQDNIFFPSITMPDGNSNLTKWRKT